MAVKVPDGVEFYCYADDLAISVIAETPLQLRLKSEEGLRAVRL